MIDNPEKNRRKILKTLIAGAFVGPLASCASLQDAGEESVDVLVLGAGLSGLSSALQLEMMGQSVRVIEARDRIGGRVHSLDNFPMVVEAGGTIVAGDYARFKGWAKQLGVAMEPIRGVDAAFSVAVNGSLISAKDWPTSPANKLPEAVHNSGPWALTGRFLANDKTLTSLGDWTDARHAELDRMSFADLLRKNGADPESLRLMNISPNTNDLETSSAIWGLREHYRRQVGGRNPATKQLEMLRAVGGNSRLVEAMGRALKTPVELNSPVESIRDDGKRVVVRCKNGRTFSAKAVISTLPFTALRNVKIEPRLSGVQAEAIATLPYTAITQYHFAVKSPYWEKDGLPPAIWSDTPFERVFAYRDDANQVRNIVVWVDGIQAQRFDKQSSQSQVSTVLRELTKARPAMQGALEHVTTVSWGNDRYAGGAYSHFAPGQSTRFAKTMAQPANRLFFAGEHTAIFTAGMEGALESADRVVGEVVSVI